MAQLLPLSRWGSPAPATCSRIAPTRQSSLVRRTSSTNRVCASSEHPQPAGPTQQQLWKAAIKLPMYSVGIVPVMVSAAAAYSQTGALDWARFAALFVGAVLVIAWLNLSNDAFDADTGVDQSKPESVVNLTGNRPAVLLLSKAFLAAGVGVLSWGISSAADPAVAPLLGAAICCGYLYQGPPFRLSYKGLGEPLCYTAFGPLATTAFYLAQLPATTGLSTAAAAPGAAAASAAATTAAAAVSSGLEAVPSLVWCYSAIVGVTTAVILFCSHFHQIQGDMAAGKVSPLVRLGTQQGCTVLAASVAMPYLLLLSAGVAGVVPLLVPLVCLLSLPQARDLVQFAFMNHTVPAAIAPLKRWAIKWHVAMAACLIAGQLGAGLVPAVLA